MEKTTNVPQKPPVGVEVGYKDHHHFLIGNVAEYTYITCWGLPSLHPSSAYMITEIASTLTIGRWHCHGQGLILEVDGRVDDTESWFLFL